MGNVQHEDTNLMRLTEALTATHMCDVSVDNVSGTALVLDGVRNMGKLSGLNQYGHSEWRGRGGESLSLLRPYWKRTTLTSLASAITNRARDREEGEKEQ